MIEAWNLEFAGLLEHAIWQRLYGTDANAVGGLFRAVLASQTMDAFARTAGSIQAYEDVLGLMREVARDMNERDQTQPQPVRMRAN